MADKELEVINNYLGNEARKLSTGQVMKPQLTEDLWDIGKRFQEAIEPYRYMLEEGNIVEYIQTVEQVIFGDLNVPKRGST